MIIFLKMEKLSQCSKQQIKHKALSYFSGTECCNSANPVSKEGTN
ncbi:hypothetical protein OTUT144_2092 [Orientia tsutsugamushi str. UT144]|uniref:Uncharacterized protein n=1 Tax=Orientia tsutsugamushi str. UT144 TaxID=1441384 RepID=A0A0F3RIP8_ORITS|nr:hypothetical protein OTUT144_2092 [Orientia tsutsugamushi str. UT144]